MFRIVIFLATNAAVLLLMSVVFSVFGLDQYNMNGQSLNLQALLIFSAIFGMGGIGLSAVIGATMAKAGRIPATRVGRQWRFRLSAIEAFLDAGGDVLFEQQDTAAQERRVVNRW